MTTNSIWKEGIKITDKILVFLIIILLIAGIYVFISLDTELFISIVKEIK